MAAELLQRHPHQIAELTLVPSSGGVFELEVDGRLIFSKKQLGRHAEPGEIERLFEQAVSGSAAG